MPTKEGHVFQPIYNNPGAKAKPGRVFYFSRHGESENNLFGKIGGNANLTSNGQKYAKALASFVNQQKLEDIQVSIVYIFKILSINQLILGVA